MKKQVILIILLVFCIASAQAANSQKIYPVNSDVYEAITHLYLVQGYSLPSTAGPWSADELLTMLERIDRSALKSGAVEVYDYVVGQLSGNDKKFRFGLEAALEGYYHTDSIHFIKEEDWIRSSDERKPLVDIVLETQLLEYFYGYSSLSVTGRRFHEHSLSEGLTSEYYGVHPFTTNVFFLYAHGIGDLDFGLPYRAFGAFGKEGWSFQVGRDKLSWGPGITGNFALGDHLRYHDMGRLTIYEDNFKYTFATSFFPHPSQYYPILEYDNTDPDYGQFVYRRSQDQPLAGMNMFMGHRLEWRLFKNKVGLTVSEAIMFQSSDNTDTDLVEQNNLDTVFDLRFLNPAMIYHNLYIRSNANSLLTLELDYNPVRYVDIYTQVALDEFAIPGEGGYPGVAPEARPTAMGLMAGAKASYPVNKGMMYGSVEWAKTDPYLYLRDDGSRKQELGEYGVNFVVAHREYAGASTHMALAYVEEFIGYEYGPDAIVLNGNVGYKQFGKWFAEGNIFYMWHGTHDKWTLWSHVYNDENVSEENNKPPYLSSPTDQHWTENNGDVNAQQRDAVSKTLVIGIKGGYTIIPGLDVYAQGDFINIVNPGNLSSNEPISDIQLSFGISYSL